MPASTTDTGATVTAPNGYICPITADLMVDPVIDAEGNSYERAAIEEWLKSTNLSPITRSVLDYQSLVPNRALKEAIELFKANNPLFGLPVNLHPQNLTTNVLDQVDDSLTIKAVKNNDYIWLSVKNQAKAEPTTPTSSDICCVVDVSGSMGAEVQLKSSEGINESFGITQLDLVKHAMKTIIESLTSSDRLSLVTFSNRSTTVFDLTVMDAAGKAFATSKLNQLRACGGTNLYDGLMTGLATMTSVSCRNASVFLLTDGRASISPPKGTIPMLKQYIEEKCQGSLGFTIQTFGFGYDLDSTLLQQIAFEGDGAYQFIPDGSFVGTIFINAMSNFLATASKNVTVNIEYPSGSRINFDLARQYKHVITSWGAQFQLGSVIHGQSKDILLGVVASSESTPSELNFECSLSYTKVRSGVDVKTPSIGVSISEDACEIELHKARLFTVNTIYECLNAAGDIHSPSWDEQFTERIATLLGVVESAKRIQHTESNLLDGLMEDIRGQMSEALLNPKYFVKWGKHYLPSLARAHLNQTCNNFKDPGVQAYGGTLFEKLRDQLHDIFCSLPPPTPSSNTYSNHVPLASMSTFANSHGTCFHEDCRLLLAHTEDSDTNRTKAMKDVVRGDEVITENGVAKVLYVLKTLCIGGQMCFVHIPKTGLNITHYHPMKKADGVWCFPIDYLNNMVTLPCEAIYSIVLDTPDAYAVCVNDTWCTSFGHTFQTKPDSLTSTNDSHNESILYHSYFGNRELVIQQMDAIVKTQGSAYSGIATVTPSFIQRSDVGLVCGIKAPPVKPSNYEVREAPKTSVNELLMMKC